MLRRKDKIEERKMEEFRNCNTRIILQVDKTIYERENWGIYIEFQPLGSPRVEPIKVSCGCGKDEREAFKIFSQVKSLVRQLQINKRVKFLR